MMKKFVSLIFISILSLSLVGCQQGGEKEVKQDDNSKPSVQENSNNGSASSKASITIKPNNTADSKASITIKPNPDLKDATLKDKDDDKDDVNVNLDKEVKVDNDAVKGATLNVNDSESKTDIDFGVKDDLKDAVKD